MLSKREFLQALGAAALLSAPGFRAAAARPRITQDSLLGFEGLGNVTLLHVTDIHAQLVPVYFREPSVNLGVGEMEGKLPHVTGAAFLKRFGISPRTLDAYMLTPEDFTALAREYGSIGGMDRMATLVKAIRAERPGKTLLLDGGDTWQGSYTSLQTQGMDMVRVMNALKPDAMTAHWEFTYGTDRVNELIEATGFDFLAANVRDTEWEEPVFKGMSLFERGGVQVAVIGQAFPYTPVANPRYKIPDWSFGIREQDLV